MAAPSYDHAAFQALAERVGGKAATRSLLREIGTQVAETVSRAAIEKKPGSQFWRDVANRVTKRAGDDFVEIGTSHVAGAFKEDGGTISAPGKGPGSRFAKYLTIPISPKAKRKNAGDFRKGATFIAKSKMGNLIIFLKQKINKNWDKSTKLLRAMMGPEPLFVLKKSVDHDPDPWWPSSGKVDAAIQRGGQIHFQRSA